jgi:hypothetical protein
MNPVSSILSGLSGKSEIDSSLIILAAALVSSGIGPPSPICLKE